MHKFFAVAVVALTAVGVAASYCPAKPKAGHRVVLEKPLKVGKHVVVPEEWLDRTKYLESSGNRWAVGDTGKNVHGGRSLGAYQIQRRTWEHYSTLPWNPGAFNPRESRRVCRMILADCIRECQRRHQSVTFSNVRWIYRSGGF